MEEAFSKFKHEQQARVRVLLAQPQDWRRHHQLLDHATHLYVVLLRTFADYPPAVALRLALAEVIELTLPSQLIGEHLLQLLAVEQQSAAQRLAARALD